MQSVMSSVSKRAYLMAFIQSSWSVILWKLFRVKPQTHTFLNKHLSLQQSNEVLKKAIMSNRPFCAVRFGAVEMGALHNYEKINFGFKKTYKKSVKISMKRNAGFFPVDHKSLSFYAKHFFKETNRTDILGVSGIHMDSYFAKKLMPHARYTNYHAF